MVDSPKPITHDEQLFNEIDNLDNLCDKHISKGEFHDAIRIAEQAMNLEDKYKITPSNREIFALPHLRLAHCWLELGEELKSHQHYKIAFDYDARYMPQLWVKFNLGVIYEKYPDIGSAVDMYSSLIEEYHDENDKIFFEAAADRLIGILYENNEYEKAQHYIKITTEKENISDNYLSNILLVNGHILTKMNQYESALKTYEDALIRAKEKRNKSIALIEMSYVYIHLKRRFKAIIYLLRALPAIFDNFHRRSIIVQARRIMTG